MDFITYFSAILLVIFLLALFAYTLRYIAQAGNPLRSRFFQQILPRELRLNPQKNNVEFKIVAVKSIDQRRRIIALDFEETRYILLLSSQQEQLLDKIKLDKKQTHKNDD